MPVAGSRPVWAQAGRDDVPIQAEWHRCADSNLTRFVSDLSGGSKYSGPMNRILPLVFLMLAPVGPVWAQALRDYEIARDAVARGEILPLSQVLQQVQRLYPGRVIDVELDEDDGLRIYEIEMVTPDGRYVEIEVDATTGTVLDYEEDD